LPAGLLRELQELLGHLYDADPGHDVRDFVVTDPALLEVLTGGVPGRDVDEKLIVMESGEGLDLALYLDAALLARLDRADPRSSLSPDNLGDFWTALEGVSHFNYLAWNAIHDRAVTLLELEMQAEVDKFVATRALLDRQPGADLGGPLWQQLFEATALMPGLSAAEQVRYRDASRLAGRYCRSLQRRFPGPALAPDALRELRGFYRAPQPRKMEHIRRLEPA
jgi:hypothetical protein